jgi:hypothetical protein
MGRAWAIPLWLLALGAMSSRVAGDAQWESLWTYTGAPGDPPNRRAHGMTIVGDDMFVYGGLGRSDMGLRDIWAFQLRQQRWRRLGQTAAGVSLPDARAGKSLELRG